MNDKPNNKSLTSALNKHEVSKNKAILVHLQALDYNS